MTFYKHIGSKAVSKPKVDLTIVEQERRDVIFKKADFVEVFAAIPMKPRRE